jgi:hypothetical protein
LVFVCFIKCISISSLHPQSLRDSSLKEESFALILWTIPKFMVNLPKIFLNLPKVASLRSRSLKAGEGGEAGRSCFKEEEANRRRSGVGIRFSGA